MVDARTYGEKGLFDGAHTGKLNATVGRKGEGGSLIPGCGGGGGFSKGG